MAAFLPAAAQVGATLLDKFLSKGNDGLQKVPTMGREQKQLHKSRLNQAMQMQGQGGGYQSALNILQQMLNPQSDIYNNFEAPYRREFEEQTIPGLAERFAGMGAQGGALSSSGFGQALGAAGAGLQEKLAYLKSGLQQSAIERLMDQYNRLSEGSLNTPEFAYMNQQGAANPLGSGANSFFQNMSPGSWQNMFKGSSGNSYQPQFGLTSGYDQQFRMDPSQMGF